MGSASQPMLVVKANKALLKNAEVIEKSGNLILAIQRKLNFILKALPLFRKK